MNSSIANWHCYWDPTACATKCKPKCSIVATSRSSLPINRCPPPVTFNPSVPEALGQVTIEPIAQHVPAECFYVRFGNFPNYLWFHNTLDRWSGDFQNLTSRRGLDFGLSERVERQISLKQSILAPLLGPAVIADVAMIGSDFFFREGPAIGMLFEARNGIGLNSDITRQRDATLKREAGCTIGRCRNRRAQSVVPLHAR